MPSWENTPAKERVCVYCESTFFAKRDIAKYCSPLCANRARPPRPKPTAEQRKAWREKRLAQPGYRERVNKVSNDRHRTVKKWLADYKISHGCVDCGYNAHHTALDIDHVEGKSFHIHKLKSVQAIKDEIARHKCVVRCANCHRIKSYETKSWEGHSSLVTDS